MKGFLTFSLVSRDSRPGANEGSTCNSTSAKVAGYSADASGISSSVNVSKDVNASGSNGSGSNDDKNDKTDQNGNANPMRHPI